MTEYKVRAAIEIGTGIQLADLDFDNTIPDPVPDELAWQLAKLLKEYGISAVIIYAENSAGVVPGKDRIIKR